jgi:phage pi2 protein 07
MEENYILITKSDYQQLIENALKLKYIEKAVDEDSNRTDAFFSSSTVQKIKFVLGKGETE